MDGGAGIGMGVGFGMGNQMANQMAQGGAAGALVGAGPTAPTCRSGGQKRYKGARTSQETKPV